MAKTIYVVIGCDTDPDRAGFLDNVPNDSLTWRGLADGIPRTKELLKNIKDSNNHPPKFTWCLRADHQVKTVHGSYQFIVQRYKDFFLQLESSGDEIGWHPHFFKYDETTNQWYQEFRDRNWQKTMLEEAHAAFESVLPNRTKSVRMGWIYHNSETFATLEKLGVETDFSAIPKLYINPKNDSIKSVNFFDWSLAPTKPYYPSRTDFRREGTVGEETSNLLEVPNFISQSILWSLISGLVLAKKMKDISQIFRSLMKPIYWISITGKPKLFAPLLSQLEKDLKQKDKLLFVSYFHPDELLPNNNSLYSLEFMAENIKSLTRLADKHGADIKFIRAADVKSEYL